MCSDEDVVSALVDVLLAMRVEEAAIAITQLLLTYSSLADLVQSQGICPQCHSLVAAWDWAGHHPLLCTSLAVVTLCAFFRGRNGRGGNCEGVSG